MPPARVGDQRISDASHAAAVTRTQRGKQCAETGSPTVRRGGRHAVRSSCDLGSSHSGARPGSATAIRVSVFGPISTLARSLVETTGDRAGEGSLWLCGAAGGAKGTLSSGEGQLRCSVASTKLLERSTWWPHGAFTRTKLTTDASVRELRSVPRTLPAPRRYKGRASRRGWPRRRGHTSARASRVSPPGHAEALHEYELQYS
jgi:hypothetical protein